MTKTQLKDWIRTLKIEDALSPQDFLELCFQKLKEHDKSLTYSRFSELLGLGSSNALYLIIKNQRNLTSKTAEKIASQLFTGFDKKYFLQMVVCQNAKTQPDQIDENDKLIHLRAQKLASPEAKGQLAFFTKWYHAAILEILRLPEAVDKADWLSQKLCPHVPKGKVEDALTLLQELGYISYSQEAGRLMPVVKSISTGAEAKHLAIAQYHRQMLELSRQAIEDARPEHRDINALTFAINQAQVEDIKQELAALRQKLKKLAEAPGEKDQVVQINMQMFLLLQKKEDS